MHVSLNQTKSPISYQACFVKNKHYNKAVEIARHYDMQRTIVDGNKLLATFPDHELKLKSEGVHNLTTKKYHKFPEPDEENNSFENLAEFYGLLAQKGNQFIENLFKP